jgi:hypothetical protein
VFTAGGLRDDLVGGLGPDERFAALVPGVDEGADRADQVCDAGEGAASDGLASDDAKDDLQLDIYGEALDSEEDLSLAQLRALATLRDRRPRMASLAAGLGLDRSTVTGLIARAEQRGPLRRTAAIDDVARSSSGLPKTAGG